MILHLTKRVKEKVKITECNSKESNKEYSFLEEWYVNLFIINRKKYLIYTEAKTLYSIVEEAKGVNGVEGLNKQAQNLIKIAFRQMQYEIEGKEDNIQEIGYYNTENRVILGSQVDLIKMAKYQIWDNDDFQFSKINETPMSYISTSPDRAFRKEIEKIKIEEIAKGK